MSYKNGTSKDYAVKLEDIGFYTLSDERAANASAFSPMWRCELILTHLCNFRCVYCRGLREDCQTVMPWKDAVWAISEWADDGLKNIRFSGGEPMTYPPLPFLVHHASSVGIKRIAVSTNGSFPLKMYKRLVELGVNDFSISLDACSAEDAEKMAGPKDFFSTLVTNIRELANLTYVSVGVVLTESSMNTTAEVVRLAHELGVADIRIITAAQWDGRLALDIEGKILAAHPILKYRVDNLIADKTMRGLSATDSHTCWLVQDDSIIAGAWHFPCVIYMREGGDPIGCVQRGMRSDRIEWMKKHDTHLDPICKTQCLDVCIDYNNRHQTLRTREIAHEEQKGLFNE